MVKYIAIVWCGLKAVKKGSNSNARFDVVKIEMNVKLTVVIGAIYKNSSNPEENHVFASICLLIPGIYLKSNGLRIVIFAD